MKDLLRRVRRTIGEDGPARAAGPEASQVEPAQVERSRVEDPFEAPDVDAETDAAEIPAGDPRWVGYIDHIERTVISGWCYDTDHPGRSVAVEAITAGGKRAMTFAAIFRQDVKDAGHGTGAYGFEIDVAGLALKDETLIIRFAESKAPISKRPFSLDPQRSLLDGRLPPGFTAAMRMLAMDVRAQHSDLAIKSAT